MAFHKNLTLASIHQVHAFSYANAAARLAATGFLSTDVGKIAQQTDNNSYYILTDESPITWQQIGSGAGSGGINFVGLDSSFAPNSSDDRDAESSIGNWAAYKDAAGVTPVDMTGGSPSVAISRTTTGGEVLNGAASFKVVKGASNLQGEGVSVLCNVPVGYRTSKCRVSLPFKVISGSLVAGDIKAFIYDVTNTRVITPFANDVAGSQGVLNASFDLTPTTAQIRVGFHFATTSTAAVTFSFDDVQVGPSQPLPTGAIVTDWEAYDLVIGSSGTPPTKGTVLEDKAEWRRVGDSIEIRWTYRQSGAGSAGTGDYRIPLPAGIEIDDTRIGVTPSTLAAIAGTFVASGGGALTAYLYPNSTTNFSAFTAAGAVWSSGGTANFGNAVLEIGFFSSPIPVKGWSSALSLASSSKFNISQYLASGTRVTGTPPTALGQYRSYRRNSSAVTYTETAADPTTPPTTADGIFIYHTGAYAAADAANQPSRFEIFVGRNKAIRPIFWENPARSSVVNGTADNLTASNINGYEFNYDPSTGIVKVNPPTGFVGGSLSTHYSALNEAGGIFGVYFDIEVSENVVGVGFDHVENEVFVTTMAGYGSTNTDILRYTTQIKNVGTAITYSGVGNGTVNGDSFLINETGLYTITICGSRLTGGGDFGISKNSSQLTTDIANITNADRLGLVNNGATNVAASLSCTVNLVAGDVIRPHGDANAINPNPAFGSFRITKLF